MRLTLTVSFYCNEKPADPQIRSFDSFPIILGRSTACDYCLNDASQYVSSNHAVILLEGSQLLIQDTSSNGVYVNGVAEAVGRGRTQVLNHEDTLAIGDYTLSVAIERNAASTQTNGVDDPFTDRAVSQGLNSSVEPYDPFKGGAPDWTPPSEEAEKLSAFEWEINEPPVFGSRQSPAPHTSDWADWPDDVGAQGRSDPADVSSRPRTPDPFSSADDDLDWLPGTSSETVSISAPLPAARKSPEPLRPRSNEAAPGQAAKSAGAPNTKDDPSRMARLRPENPPSAVSRQMTPADRYAVEPAGSAAQLKPMLRAASLRESDFAHLDNTEVLEQTGRLLAQMVDAMMVLLKSRAELKNFIHADVTTLARSDNNPLKFSVSAADALSKLLANDTDGYLPADRAVQEAVEDLKLHQLAMLEGMKSAVRSLLLQFDPDKLARTLEKTGGIAASIPITREAKLWEMFREQYDAIREEAVNDFGELFGAEFRKAYEKRIRKTGRRPDF